VSHGPARGGALARVRVTRYAEQRTVDGLVHASGEREQPPERLPAYLTAATVVVLADAEAPDAEAASPASVSAAARRRDSCWATAMSMARGCISPPTQNAASATVPAWGSGWSITPR
jgi:hypothetical protein